MELTQDWFIDLRLLPSYRRRYFEVVSFYVVFNTVSPSLLLFLYYMYCTSNAFNMVVCGAKW